MTKDNMGADSAQQPERSLGSSLGERFRAGGWYFVLIIGSAGILSPIPIWHAWSRLRTNRLLQIAVAYSVLAMVTVLLIPRRPEGAETSTDQSSPVPAFLALALMVSACIVLVRPRREIFGLSDPVERAMPLEPAVQRALEGRARREKARSIVESDQPLARELRIGRPDLERDYEDGGLVDVNSAPAHVIAQVCSIDPAWAEAVVTARAARGVYYHHTELLLDIPFPEHVAERIRDRGVYIS